MLNCLKIDNELGDSETLIITLLRTNTKDINDKHFIKKLSKDKKVLVLIKGKALYGRLFNKYCLKTRR